MIARATAYIHGPSSICSYLVVAVPPGIDVFKVPTLLNIFKQSLASDETIAVVGMFVAIGCSIS